MIWLLAASVSMIALSYIIVWNYLPEDNIKWLLDVRADYVAIPSGLVGCCGFVLLALNI